MDDVSERSTHTKRCRPTTSSASWSAICSGSGCYPAKGFQIHQDIPDDVWRAYEELVEAGYDKYLVMSIMSTVRAQTLSRWSLACAAAALSLCATATGRAQTGYRPTAANLAAREWFQDARFGLFVHWGVYSVLGDGEWVMNNRKIPVADYEKLPAQFNPVEFDAAEWVALAKAAGHEVHHHHEQASRRLRDVRLEGLRLQHRRAHAVSRRTSSKRSPRNAAGRA